MNDNNKLKILQSTNLVILVCLIAIDLTLASLYLIGVEVIHAQFFKQYIPQIAVSLNSTTTIVNSVKDTIEELTELLGESITLFGLTLFFSFRLAERDGEMGKMESKI